MQNDPSAPGAPPSRGFASIITLVSDVSKDLAALEQAPPEPPPPPRVAPSPPPRAAPPPPQPPPPQPQTDPWAAQRRSETGTYFRYVKPKPVSSNSGDSEDSTWFYMLVAFIVFLLMVLSSK